MMLLTLVIAASLCGLASCGNDEPDAGAIDYYIEVEEQFLVNGSLDGVSRYDNPITLMNAAIQRAYPTKTQQGADQEVIAACDKAYEDFVALYEGDLRDENLTALVNLKRVVRRGGTIRENETLKAYLFNVNYHEEGQ